MSPTRVIEPAERPAGRVRSCIGERSDFVDDECGRSKQGRPPSSSPAWEPLRSGPGWGWSPRRPKPVSSPGRLRSAPARRSGSGRAGLPGGPSTVRAWSRVGPVSRPLGRRRAPGPEKQVLVGRAEDPLPAGGGQQRSSTEQVVEQLWGARRGHSGGGLSARAGWRRSRRPSSARSRPGSSPGPPPRHPRPPPSRSPCRRRRCPRRRTSARPAGPGLSARGRPGSRRNDVLRCGPGAPPARATIGRIGRRQPRVVAPKGIATSVRRGALAGPARPRHDPGLGLPLQPAGPRWARPPGPGPKSPRRWTR